MTLRVPSELYTAAQAVAADRHTLDDLGVPSSTLMERAALCVSHEVIASRAGEDLPVFVMVGPGNNGADGLAVARQLHGWGVAVEAALCTDVRGEAVQQQLAWARACGVQVHERFPVSFPPRAIVVDALLGTGSRGAPRGGIAKALTRYPSIRGPRVAIDVPSGVDVDTGAVAELAFEADVTVTFVRSKPGLHVTPGRAHAGVVVVADIGIAPVEPSARHRLIDPAWVQAVLGGLPPGRHKGDRGHVGVYGGSLTTPGAAVLAATAAFRAGAGLVTIVTGSAEVRELLVACRPELMVAAPPDQSPMLAGVDAWVVGPGLTDPLAAAGLSAFYGTDPQPAVWDASALDQLPLGVLPTGPRVITPHPGEAARLLARAEADDTWSSGRVQHGRIDAARRLAERTGAVAVLKGEGTLVAAPDGTCHVAVVGGPALATAGSGDCLAGLIGALLARGLPPFDAACAAVHVHGLAGEQAAERFAYPRAGDIADAVDDVMRSERLARPVARWPRMRYG